jgi:hypothetical protein
MEKTKSTILFRATLVAPPSGEKNGSCATLLIPKTAGANLPSQPTTIIEGTLNGYPFRATLEQAANKTHTLKLSKSLLAAADANLGETVSIEITRLDDEPETRPPLELLQTLAATPKAQATWTTTTPLARRDWILWITSGKQSETRLIRIKKAASMLASGKKRVCCFGGLNWLTKDHPKVETWLPLPTAK